MNVFDIDNEERISYSQGDIIWKKGCSRYYYQFLQINAITPKEIHLKPDKYNSVYLNSENLGIIKKLAVQEGKDISFSNFVNASLEEENNFFGITINHKGSFSISPSNNREVHIKNLILRCNGTKRHHQMLSLADRCKFTLENVYIENEPEFYWYKDIKLVNSHVSCGVLKITSFTENYQRIKRMIKREDFKGIKKQLEIPLDCVEFNSIAFGKDVYTREQYENW